MPSPNVLGICFDKIVHLCFYAGLNTLLISTIIAHKTIINTKQILATTIASVIYGVAIEFIQEQVGRDFDLYDIVANFLGSIAAAVILVNSKIKELISNYLQKSF